jgi:hypothetical protein
MIELKISFSSLTPYKWHIVKQVDSVAGFCPRNVAEVIFMGDIKVTELPHAQSSTNYA